MSLSNLPTELLVEIFDYLCPYERLHTIQQVCQTFKSIIETTIHNKFDRIMVPLPVCFYAHLKSPHYKGNLKPGGKIQLYPNAPRVNILLDYMSDGSYSFKFEDDYGASIFGISRPHTYNSKETDDTRHGWVATVLSDKILSTARITDKAVPVIMDIETESSLTIHLYKDIPRNVVKTLSDSSKFVTLKDIHMEFDQYYRNYMTNLDIGLKALLWTATLSFDNKNCLKLSFVARRFPYWMKGNFIKGFPSSGCGWRAWQAS